MDANLDAAAVLALRREAYAKPAPAREDLANLLASGRSAGGAASAEYVELLCQLATDLLVEQVDPRGYIRQEDADWLVGQLQAGAVSCAAEYAMLTHVIGAAVSVPASLADFAVAEIEKAVGLGHASASGAANHPAGVVTRADVEALRAAVFAASEDSSLHVTRASAEALFRIARIARSGSVDPSFDAFFAGAVGNYLTGVAHRWTPSAADELADEKSLAEKPSFGGFLGGLMRRGGAKPGPRGSVDELVSAKFEEENAADEQALAAAQAADPAKTAWLLGELTAGGPLTSAQTALIQFLKTEAPAISASLLAAAAAPA